MEKITQETKSEKESLIGISYKDLIKMYYYEAKKLQNPFYEKHFKAAVLRLAGVLKEILKEHPYVVSDEYSEEEIRLGKGEAALRGYFKDFYYYLNRLKDEEELFKEINGFIMYIHERLRLSLGKELLGFSQDNLEALNHLDPDQPLEKQEEIIYKKIQGWRGED